MVVPHYGDVVMGTVASQIISLTIVYSTVDSGADQRKHQSSASLAFVRGIHRGPVNYPHKWPVTRKMLSFHDVIMDVSASLAWVGISIWYHIPICMGRTFVQITHWGRDTMDAISQTTFSSAFSWMKMFEYRLKFHWNLFLSIQLTIFQHWFR